MATDNGAEHVADYFVRRPETPEKARARRLAALRLQAEIFETEHGEGEVARMERAGRGGTY